VRNFLKNQTSKSDQELLSAYYQKEDLAAFETLFLRYSHLTFFMCMKYLNDEEKSKDAVLEIFGSALKGLKRNEVINFKNWLYATIRNHCYSMLRKETVRERSENKFSQNEKYFMENFNFETLIDSNKEKKDLLLAAIEKLAFDQRECVRLFYFENLSYRQIAEHAQLDIKKVKSALQNGRRNLKNILHQYQEFRNEK